MIDFASARAVADAVLLEGYCLYPYRASAPKNQNPYRWQFGVLAPRAWSEAGGCEPWWFEAQCLVRGTDVIEGRLRLLQRVQRKMERARWEDRFEPVESLDVQGQLWVAWDEAEVREIPLRAGLARAREGLQLPFELPASRDVELLHQPDGALVGRVVREQGRICGRIGIQAHEVGPNGLVQVDVRVECTTPWLDATSSRQEVLSGACLSTHLLLGADGGRFVSVQDPPAWASGAARACRSVRTYPVLTGPQDRNDLLLCAPIILYDHAQVAAESPGDFFDATEIDELLTLRTAALAPEEKREVRATDPRAAAILDRVERMPSETFARLHGVMRPSPEVRRSGITRGESFRPGTRVRLRPGSRRTDAQDLLYAGQPATVEKVMHDIDGETCLAVTVDADPAAELHRWYGRFHYYYPDEVELLADGGSEEVWP